MTTVFLIEDNAGKLLIGNDERGYFAVQPTGAFADDAAAFAAGDTQDWTVDWYSPDAFETSPENDAVAVCVDGAVTTLGRLGIAGAQYIGATSTLELGVSNLHYDGYRWVKHGSRDIHCRYLEEEDRTEYTPADDTDGMWVKIIYNDGTVRWGERSPSAFREAHLA